ncbi:SH3-like domain-containing protein [Actinomycetospora cinnamomea]|uniref:Nitrile hydratase n=1 Tax=Actinomycetospora cinnamomea TaxID=663609 RepID=A0A2U1EZM8_9PSEU|nr:nitrile hydratase [Actinomycetospora cinnamomea]
MPDRFAAGDRVRTGTVDPPHHTRLPRYARGVCGEVVATAGHHPLADERARGLPSTPRAVYCVRFAAHDLFGEGDHAVVVELFEDYLEPAEREVRR